MRVVVTGAAGQLGAAVLHEWGGVHDVIPFARAELDVADDAAVAEAIARTRPTVIVNAAAFTNVDAAEDRPVDALRVNAFGPRALAAAARLHDATLVHYSTDFVFDGTASEPYAETDRPNPQSTYAASKLLGEWFALEAPRAYVLRVETLFGRAPDGPAEKGSIAAIAKSLVAGDSPPVFVDRTISPTYVIDAARATLALLTRNAPPGIYHCVNTGRCTWLEFAEELARQLGVTPRFKPVRMADLQLKARRPLYCALSNEKLRAVGVDMPAWTDALGRSIAAAATAQNR